MKLYSTTTHVYIAVCTSANISYEDIIKFTCRSSYIKRAYYICNDVLGDVQITVLLDPFQGLTETSGNPYCNNVVQTYAFVNCPGNNY